MSVICTIVVGILCVNAPSTGNLTVRTDSFGTGGSFAVEGASFGISSAYSDVIPPPFKTDGASQVCAGTVCLAYRRSCEKTGDATNCRFELPGTIFRYVGLSAQNDTALQFALKNIAIAFHDEGGQSSFPLSLLDGSAPVPQGKSNVPQQDGKQER